MLTLALSKGRIFSETLPLLKQAGITVDRLDDDPRKLILSTSHPQLRVIIVRASDVPTYVEYGGADLGIAGKDILMEYSGKGFYQPIDLNIAQCRMAVAVSRDYDYAQALHQRRRLRVATKYEQIAREHFSNKGLHVDIIELYGSMELAPIVGLADAIVDLVSTGNTLAANNLVEVEKITDISSCLIINQAAFKLKTALLIPLLKFFREAAARHA